MIMPTAALIAFAPSATFKGGIVVVLVLSTSHCATLHLSLYDVFETLKHVHLWMNIVC
jgi:hypothetical protein